MSVDLYDNKNDQDPNHDQDEKYNDPKMSEVSVVDPQQSWADLQSRLYSEEAEKIADNKWRQLRCKTQTMTYDVTWVKCIYIIIGVICIPIGVVTYNLSQSVVMQEFAAYNSISDCSLTAASNSSIDFGKECVVNYTLDYDFEPPIYFHYKLTNFYQNHRSYVKSRTEAQLHNTDPLDTSDCDPEAVRLSQASSTEDLIMLPCGLIANSFFNDKYKVTYFEVSDNGAISKAIPFCNSTQCTKDEKTMDWSNATWSASPNWVGQGIAWSGDIDGKFEYTPQISGKTTDINQLQQTQNLTLPYTNDEDFVVWMRTATTSTFTKLHRIIKGQKLKKGSTLQVTIRNYFRVDDFDGTKSIVITTNSSLGGKNEVMGITFMVIGGVSILTAVCFRLLIPPKRSRSMSMHDL